MRKRMLFILSFILMGLTMMSCSKDKAVPETENLDAVLEEIFTADVMEGVLAEVFNDIFDGSDYEMYKSGEESDGHKCRTRTIERPTDEPFPKIVTLEFDGNCKNWKESGNLKQRALFA